MKAPSKNGVYFMKAPSKNGVYLMSWHGSMLHEIIIKVEMPYYTIIKEIKGKIFSMWLNYKNREVKDLRDAKFVKLAELGQVLYE